MDQAPPTLETQRLTLRPFTAADAGDTRRLAGDRDVAATTLRIPHPYLHEEAEAWIATHRPGWRDGTLCNCAIVRSADASLLGCVGLIIDPGSQSAELGYWIGKPYWNRGYATEAARALMQYGFETLGLTEIHARHMSRNVASGRVIRKLGMNYTERREKDVERWGVLEDMDHYRWES